MVKLLNVVAVLVLLSMPLRADIIERILATVGGTLILQSDAVAVVRLGFVHVPPGQADPLQYTLDRLVERRLMLIEVERYGPTEPTLTEIDAQMQALDQRIGSGERLDEIMRETGLSAGQLRVFIRDELRLAAYLKQRFTGIYDPREDEILQYYKEHEAEFTVGGQLRPFPEVREQARQVLMEQRRVAAIRDWLTGLRRRTEVNILYLR